MFWSGNYIVVRELNFLLKEENVTLSQVLEADDILQECKADNKALMQFLTRPDILAELITLITEEPPHTVELGQQYRHASIACEVLTSPLSSLSDRLSLDKVQMNRLCDFLNKDPPLNPLLASYFSKTIEMLLERNPKQDWYLYHIVCLRVLDFFKSRRDFLPNLLRHMCTSAIADIFKYFIRLDDLFNKIVMEWLEENQFMECVVQIICGTYSAEAGAGGGGGGGGAAGAGGGAADLTEKGQREPSEKEHNHTPNTHTEHGSHDHENNECAAGVGGTREGATRRARLAAVAAANACELLCELVGSGCAAEGAGAGARSRTAAALVARLAGAGGPRALLQAVFTCGPRARPHALHHGARLLRRLLDHHAGSEAAGEGGTPRSQVELAVAPHLPLLHQALLRDPATYAQEEGSGERGAGAGGGGGAVGAARIQTAALLAHLASSEVEEVATTMLTLGTPGVLVDMFFRYPHNNFLHATLLAFVRNALANPVYRTQYTAHLLVECDLLTRLMDVFEENENKQAAGPRAGYMGHVTLLLSRLQCALAEDSAALAAPLAARWRLFAEEKLDPAVHHFTQPLGGAYPSENSYEGDTSLSDRLTSYYDASAEGGVAGAVDSDAVMMEEEQHYRDAAKNRFLELADQRFDDDMWDEGPEGEGEGEGEAQVAEPPAAALLEVLGEGSPWDGSGASEAPPSEEGWAQFGAPADPFADFQGGFSHFWPYDAPAPPGEAEGAASERCVSLATNLLSAMSAMSPADLANIVNANLQLDALPSRTDGEVAPTEQGENLTGGSEIDTGIEVEEMPPGSEEDTEHERDNVPAPSCQDTDIEVEHVGAGGETEGAIDTKAQRAPEENAATTEKQTDSTLVDSDTKVSDESANNSVLPANDATCTPDATRADASPNTTNKDTNASHAPTSIQSNPTNTAPVSPTDDLKDLTEKMNDICLQSQNSPDSKSPTKTPTEPVIDNEKVLESCEESPAPAGRRASRTSC